MAKKTEKKIKFRDWIVLGRLIGQASGWDEGDGCAIQLYDFVAATKYVGPVGDIYVDFEDGFIKGYDKDGNETASVDLIDAVKDCERKTYGKN